MIPAAPVPRLALAASCGCYNATYKQWLNDLSLRDAEDLFTPEPRQLPPAPSFQRATTESGTSPYFWPGQLPERAVLQRGPVALASSAPALRVLTALGRGV